MTDQLGKISKISREIEQENELATSREEFDISKKSSVAKSACCVNAISVIEQENDGTLDAMQACGAFDFHFQGIVLIYLEFHLFQHLSAQNMKFSSSTNHASNFPTLVGGNNGSFTQPGTSF